MLAAVVAVAIRLAAKQVVLGVLAAEVLVLLVHQVLLQQEMELQILEAEVAVLEGIRLLKPQVAMAVQVE
jgi:hypothetical protein